MVSYKKTDTQTLDNKERMMDGIKPNENGNGQHTQLEEQTTDGPSVFWRDPG